MSKPRKKPKLRAWFDPSKQPVPRLKPVAQAVAIAVRTPRRKH